MIWYLPNALGPKVLIKTRINTDILGSHLDLSKLLDLVDSPGCLALESTKNMGH